MSKYARIFVNLTGEDIVALKEIAHNEYRDFHQQAAMMIREGIERARREKENTESDKQ